ncbi:MAG: ABC transporter ATP-binding protein [Clostridiales bacterium]|nr:ABC transporter ATP-binding protein [Clostridiales bacterium]
MKLFQLTNVEVNYGMDENMVHALNGISLEIEEHEKIAITGPSGSGKSTLLNALSGIEKISKGNIFFRETDFSKFTASKLSELRLKHFGFVFQNFYLISSMTVRDNIYLPAIVSQGEVDKEFFEKLVTHLHIDHRLNHLSGQLSGGEKQRVPIARALIHKPEVIFADEPSGNLDSKNGEEVFRLLFQMTEEFQQTLIYVTHDMEKAKMAERQIKIKDGMVDNNDK